MPILHLGLPDAFQHHASREALLAEAGLDADGIRAAILGRWPQLAQAASTARADLHPWTGIAPGIGPRRRLCAIASFVRGDDGVALRPQAFGVAAGSSMSRIGSTAKVVVLVGAASAFASHSPRQMLASHRPCQRRRCRFR